MTADVLTFPQPREQTCPCIRHCGRKTWNTNAVCDTCTRTQIDRRAAVLTDEAILDAVRRLDGDWTPDDFHNAALVLVCTAISPLDRILAAKLYGIAETQGDHLQVLVRDIADAHLALVEDIPAEHDGIPCRGPVGDACLDCRAINQQVFDEPMTRLRDLLGSTVADMAQVAA